MPYAAQRAKNNQRGFKTFIMDFTEDINAAAAVISRGGIILYPTDTIWGIGCDATNHLAIAKIYLLKKREETKSMIILVNDADQIGLYVNNPPKTMIGFLLKQDKPTTAIFENVKNLPVSLTRNESIAIRIVKDEFCQALIKKCGVPLVSTSANISGENFPGKFDKVTDEIKNGVDYVVQHRKDDLNIYQPSSIIKLNDEGEIEKIR